MNTSVLQAAQAFSVIANGGIKRPVSLLRVDHVPEGERVIAREYTEQVKKMLKRVVTTEGTGRRARAISYSVAGKTGTALKAVGGKYDSSKQMGSFIGMAPADKPRIVALVVIDEPKGSGMYANGGYVAAPAFSNVAEHALRMLHVPPDNPSDLHDVVARAQEAARAAVSPSQSLKAQHLKAPKAAPNVNSEESST